MGKKKKAKNILRDISDFKTSRNKYSDMHKQLRNIEQQLLDTDTLNEIMVIFKQSEKILSNQQINIGELDDMMINLEETYANNENASKIISQDIHDNDNNICEDYINDVFCEWENEERNININVKPTIKKREKKKKKIPFLINERN